MTGVAGGPTFPSSVDRDATFRRRWVCSCTKETIRELARKPGPHGNELELQPSKDASATPWLPVQEAGWMVSTGLCGIPRGARFALTGGFFLLTPGDRDSLM